MQVPHMLRLFWDRVTFTRLTAFYFLFSIVHCLIQVIFQVQAFSINAQAVSLLSNILTQGNATLPGFVVFDNDLRSCQEIPSDTTARSCSVIWSPFESTESISPFAAVASAPPTTTTSTSSTHTATTSSIQATQTSQTTSSSSIVPSSTSVSTRETTSVLQRTVTVTAFTSTPTASNEVRVRQNLAPELEKRSYANIRAAEVNGTTEVTVTGLGNSGKPLVLDHTCLVTLNWPVSVLRDTKREDVTFIAFQLWVLGMSVVALLNESIPHVFASLLSHLLATSWAIYQIVNTARFHSDFARLTTNGACKPNNLLPTYWKDRGNAEIPGLALNVVGLCVSTFLTWRLVKLFGWQTFKRVGASLTINRVYKVVLTLSIVIQLSLFFMVTTIALWIDQLYNGPIAQMARLSTVYKVVFIVTLVFLVPWLMTGWFAVRREIKLLMMIFLVLCILYMGGWAVMFVSTSFRWTFIEWRFFSVIATASVILTFIAFCLGLICRVNFGKGLHRYLNAQELIPGEDMPYDGSEDPEKVYFPSTEKPIPTFSAAFGSGTEVPLPNQMFPQYGPRSYGRNGEPLQIHIDVAEPQPARTRTPTTGEITPSLARQGSRSSEKSFDSIGSSGSQRSKRWVIE